MEKNQSGKTHKMRGQLTIDMQFRSSNISKVDETERKTETFVVSYQKMNYFFKSKPQVQVDQLKITNIGLYSVTPWKEADLISGWIWEFLGGAKNNSQFITMTDATANVGGNTISFHLSGFDQVNSIEKDPLTAQILSQNLQAYQLPTKNVHCCDYLSIYKELSQDIVFFDPPWGGPDYKKAKTLDLYLSEVNIINICQELLAEKRANLVVIKIPINYNINNFVTQMSGYHFSIRKVYRYKYHSYSVLFCW